jgi:peptidoglycan hydrolase-like protein with peptidoglycan-binding domain
MLIILVVLAFAGLLHESTALAASTFKAKTTCRLYSKISRKAKTLKIPKGRSVVVYQVKGKWCKVSVSGVKGYMLKGSLTKGVKRKSVSRIRTLKAGDSGSAVKKLQVQLARRGFISSKSAGGKYSSTTSRAIRQYQMMSGLSVSGVATTATIRKLFSCGSRRPKVTMTRWSNYTVSKFYPDGGLATIVDLNTGARLRIRRVGGHNHLDVEPAYASDTAVLRRMYGGAWSWDSRAVLLIVNGHYIAGAINGMPHGIEISKSNNYDGQFCLHLYGSKTHGSGDSNSAHQYNIRRVYHYFN